MADVAVGKTERRLWAVTDPADALFLEALAAGVSDRKLRLLSCACVRQMWQYLDDPRRRAAVETAERYADGHATEEQLAAAQSASRSASPLNAVDAATITMALVVGRAVFALTQTGGDRVWLARVVWKESARRSARVRRFRTALLSCVVGPRPLPTGNPAWLAWQGGAIAHLSQAAYEERQMPHGTFDNARLALLADALEDAGCTDAELLGHLRGPGPHVRGCWAVDLVLGKS